ncbi:hypothetical protein E2F47_01865 [Mycobacterium eburneum]|nr:hypothetical protein E2F47_01865 [Mycobacterium eburneum]
MATLTALRDILARQIDTATEPRDVASLSRQFTDVLAKIDAMKPRPKSKRDELAARRERRRSAAAGAADAADSVGAAGPDKRS